jgi:hypothetical protein
MPNVNDCIVCAACGDDVQQAGGKPIKMVIAARRSSLAGSPNAASRVGSCERGPRSRGFSN